MVGWFENHDPSYHSFNPVKSLNGFLVASEAMQEALGAGPSEEQESAFKEPALVEPKKGKGKVPVVGERGHDEWTKIEEEGVLEERLETEWIELCI